MPITPTPQQLRCLRFVAGHVEQAGVFPCYRGIATALGLSGDNSKGAIHLLLTGLERRGWIARRAGKPPRGRSPWQLLHSPPLPRAPDGAPLYAVTPRQQGGQINGHGR